MEDGALKIGEWLLVLADSRRLFCEPRLRLYNQREGDGLLQHCTGVEHTR